MIVGHQRQVRALERAGFETVAGAVPFAYGAAAVVYAGSRIVPKLADRVTPFVGLNPKKSFFTPFDLIPFVGPLGKIQKGYRLGKKGIGTVALGTAQLASDLIFFGYLAMDIFGGPDKPRTMINSTVTPGRGDMSSQSSRKSARSGNRRRKRCTHRDSRGRRCVLPAGHSGRHKYA